jgi:hypothetical protein
MLMLVLLVLVLVLAASDKGLFTEMIMNQAISRRRLCSVDVYTNRVLRGARMAAASIFCTILARVYIWTLGYLIGGKGVQCATICRQKVL